MRWLFVISMVGVLLSCVNEDDSVYNNAIKARRPDYAQCLADQSAKGNAYLTTRDAYDQNVSASQATYLVEAAEFEAGRRQIRPVRLN